MFIKKQGLISVVMPLPTEHNESKLNPFISRRGEVTTNYIPSFTLDWLFLRLTAWKS